MILFYLLLTMGIILATSWLLSQGETEKLQYSEIVDLFQKEKVEKFVVTNNDELIITKKGSDTPISFKLRSLQLFKDDLGDLIIKQHEKGIITKYNYDPPVEIPWWMSLLPYAIIIILFIVLWFYVMNQAVGGKGGKMNSFGRARAKLGSHEKNKVLFSDVAGADEEKEELKEVVDFLRNPSKFDELGAKIPRGVLLVGPPGTGKTLLAKAVAGEAKVPFYSISGSDFVEMYVGVGASRVRDLFDTAKKTPPAIIFIDEIDAVGRHRGAGLGGGHDEREQTLNQLLVEMDGFGNNEGVIVIAATNRPDILDPALLRPGRFDRQITVGYPDIKGREQILKVHSKGKPFEDNVDLAVLAKSTAGFTGADLANLLNEAALLAARKGKKLIGMQDLEDATIKVIVGPQKRSRVISDKEKKLTAFHEAGHAVVTHILETQDAVHQISIIPAGRAGGYTLSLPTEDKYYSSKMEMEEEIVSLLGGRVSEQLVLSDISTGASNDIQRATKISRKMITQYGMSEKLGPIVYGTGHEEVFLGRDIGNTRDFSEKVAAEIDDEVKKMIETAYNSAKQILTDNMEKLHIIANFLIKHEIMDGEQFAAIMNGNPTEEELLEIAKAKAQKSKSENEKRNEQNELQKQKDAEEEKAHPKDLSEKKKNSLFDIDNIYPPSKDDENKDDKHDGDKK